MNDDDKKRLGKSYDEFNKEILAIGAKFGSELSRSSREGTAIETIEKFRGEFRDLRQLSRAELKGALDSTRSFLRGVPNSGDVSKAGLLGAGTSYSSLRALTAFFKGASIGYRNGSVPEESSGKDK